MRVRTIKVEALARVEGEGSIRVRLRGDEAIEVQFGIFEPARFFEGFLRGRDCHEAPDLTSRICGICPVAYLMSACHAVEDALGVRVEGGLRALRRLLYCGEWIESHALHVFLLQAPDLLGYPDAIAMAADHAEIVQRGLRMKKAGNAIVAALGGRSIHPVNVRVGGFYRVPRPAELEELLPELRWGREAARASLQWAANLRVPELERDYDFFALRHPDEYPFTEGRLTSSHGLDAPVGDYERHLREEQVPHSNALQSHGEGGAEYCSGPLARFNLDYDRLSEEARAAATAAGLAPPLRNPFKSVLVRLVEILQAFGEAVALIEAYTPPPAPYVPAPSRAATGHGCTEAPRGALYHRYTVDEEGTITEANIVPPTSRNLATIESDLRALAPQLAALPLPAATLLAEQAVRNHDPCISCATHCLRVRIERG
ncbi:MAG TPA: nickel-dependent hydrogenase large subunit [Polyangia bacterium]|jgi:coenzyme F420-reducing hydrogenase alpha subunit